MRGASVTSLPHCVKKHISTFPWMSVNMRGVGWGSALAKPQTDACSLATSLVDPRKEQVHPADHQPFDNTSWRKNQRSMKKNRRREARRPSLLMYLLKSKSKGNLRKTCPLTRTILRPTPQLMVIIPHNPHPLTVDDGRVNININSKTEALKRFLPAEEEVEPEKLKLEHAFFPDLDETNFRNPPMMNIVIQIVGSRGISTSCTAKDRGCSTIYCIGKEPSRIWSPCSNSDTPHIQRLRGGNWTRILLHRWRSRRTDVCMSPI